MPVTYALIKLLHVLLLVYWLGGDIGVYYAAGRVRDPSLPIEGRRVALRIMLWVDMIPRYCLVLMLPVGFTLAMQIEAIEVTPTALALIWIAGLAWLANVAAIHHLQGTALGERLRRIDLAWRLLVIAALLWSAWRGFAGDGLVRVDWLAAKFLVFALLVFCGVMIRLRGAPLGPALRAVLSTGSTPELEAIIARTSRNTRPWVLGIWGGLVVAAYIAIAKPAFT